MATTKKDERPKLKSSHGAAPPPKKAAQAKKKAKDVLPARAREAAEGRAPQRAPKAATATDTTPASAKGKSKRGADVSESTASDDARRTAVAIALAALEKKAVGLEILDVAGRVDYADFLVLMSGRSDRHTASLAEGIEESLNKSGRRALSIEGLPHANWVLMDYGDVVVHVFQDDARSAYDLEGLWMDAQRLPLPADRA